MTEKEKKNLLELLNKARDYGVLSIHDADGELHFVNRAFYDEQCGEIVVILEDN